jgi:activator of 2-hydroxyglutaryl-CoA dehydratase
VTQLLGRPTSITSGVDIGARSVKIAILSHRRARPSVLATSVVPVLGNHDPGDVRAAMRDGWARALAEANLSTWDVDNVASTGTGDRAIARVGHFYGHLTHALGGRLLFPDATVALDIGVNHIHCDLLDDMPNGRLDVAPREATDGGALRESMAARAAALLRALADGGKVVLTGGTVLDAAFVHSLWSRLVTSASNISLLISPEGVFAGAYGAAILAARRLGRISPSFGPDVTDPFVLRAPDRHGRSLN